MDQAELSVEDKSFSKIYLTQAFTAPAWGASPFSPEIVANNLSKDGNELGIPEGFGVFLFLLAQQLGVKKLTMEQFESAMKLAGVSCINYVHSGVEKA